MGRLLLIGGTGFLGSHVARRLVDRQPLALVRSSSDRELLPPGVALRTGDLAQEFGLSDVESVVYCASMGFGHVPPLVPRLEAAGVRRAVFISTTAIFTSLPAASRAVRLEAERAVQDSRLDWTILRPTMIYGSPRDRNISRLLRWVHHWRVVPVCGNALWQPVHVDDVADAVVAALDCPAAVGRAFNIAGGEPLRFRDLVRACADAVNRPALLVPVPLAAAVGAARLTRVVTPEQVHRLVEDKAFDYSDATRTFGFSPRTFRAGVRSQARALGLAPR